MRNLCNINFISNDFVGGCELRFVPFGKTSLFDIVAQTMSKADSIMLIFTDRYVVVALRLFCLSGDALNGREFVFV